VVLFACCCWLLPCVCFFLCVLLYGSKLKEGRGRGKSRSVGVDVGVRKREREDTPSINTKCIDNWGASQKTRANIYSRVSIPPLFKLQNPNPNPERLRLLLTYSYSFSLTHTYNYKHNYRNTVTAENQSVVGSSVSVSSGTPQQRRQPRRQPQKLSLQSSLSRKKTHQETEQK
jgi:hypothetical protein